VQLPPCPCSAPSWPKQNAPQKCCHFRLVILKLDVLADLVTSASYERSFSALLHIKTRVRNSMSKGRLSNVADMAIEREHTMSISHEKIIDAFAAAHQNRPTALIKYRQVVSA